MPDRDDLLARISAAAQRTATDGVVMHQAVADRLGLHVTDLRCLNMLRLDGPATPGDLAARTGLTTGAITRMIDRLVASGYAHRDHDSTDRRRVIVSAVPARIAEIAPLYEGVAASWAALMAEYTDDQLTMILDLFNRFHETSVRLTAELRTDAS